MDVSDIIGSFGRWQLYVFLLLFYTNVIGMMQNLSITFLAPNMDFWCVEPKGLNDTSPSFDARCNVALPTNQSEHLVVPCKKWDYDTSSFSSTLVNEWDLVCDSDWLISLLKSVYMVGCLLSVIFFGQLADSIGRFPSMIIACFINLVCMFLSLLSTSYAMFATLRFLQAFGRLGFTTIGFVLVLEIVGPEHQTGVGIVIQLGWSLGFVTLAGVAWFVRNWFWLQLVIGVAFLLIIPFYGIMPESPRWLLMRGKTEKLGRILTRAAAINKKKLNAEDLERLKWKPKEEENKASETVFDLFKTPQLRYRTLIMCYTWLVNSFVYYALSFNTNDLAGDPYLNFFIAGALEFPTYGLLYWCIRRFGRRPTLVILMLVGGASCLAVISVPQDVWWISTSLAMVGKSCITASFGLIWLYTTELFPTVVRNVALGSCSMNARVGSSVAPFVRELGYASHPAVSNIIFGILAISSGLLSLLLPETKGQSMPDTLEEGENFGKSERNNSRTFSTTHVTPT